MLAVVDEAIPSVRPRYGLRFMVGLIAIAGAGAYVCAPAPVGELRAAPPALGAGADAQRLEAHVRALAKGPRSGRGQPRALHEAAEYVQTELERAGYGATKERLTTDFENVVARMGPEAGARIVVGAHYDTVEDTPGADDNASGVAALIELARLLRTATVTCPVELVAYALEEPPFFRTPDMGSSEHARSLATRHVEVRAMLSLEMLGTYSDAPSSQNFPSAFLAEKYPSAANFVLVVGRLEDRALAEKTRDAMSISPSLPIYAFVAPATFAGVDFSDHASYWAAGYSAVMITDTAFFRNPRYHAPADTPDMLDYPRLAHATNAVFAAVLALCESP